MSIEDRKKIVAWLKEQAEKLKAGPHTAVQVQDMPERIARLEKAIEREEAIIRALEGKPNFVDFEKRNEGGR
jgi:hypothetical protein